MASERPARRIFAVRAVLFSSNVEQIFGGNGCGILQQLSNLDTQAVGRGLEFGMAKLRESCCNEQRRGWPDRTVCGILFTAGPGC
jgi:hypothetical protein